MVDVLEMIKGRVRISKCPRVVNHRQAAERGEVTSRGTEEVIYHKERQNKFNKIDPPFLSSLPFSLPPLSSFSLDVIK